MKTYFFGFFVAAMVMVMLFGGAASAFSWEGAAAIAPEGDLPGGGYSIATNSFPVNSILDIKNLENDKVVRVNVVSGLNSAGLMATLSRDTADAIGVYGDSSCRILMGEVSHEIDLPARLTLGPVIEPEADPLEDITVIASEDEDAEDLLLTGVLIADVVTDENTLEASSPQTISSETTSPEASSSEADTIAAASPEAEGTLSETADDTIAAVQPETTQAEENEVLPPVRTTPPTGVISLAASEERTPSPANRPIPREYLAPPLRTYVPPASFSPFQAPLISSLEQGKSYVQIGAYARADNVEDEITRVGKDCKEYPVAIQNIGTDSKPLFRVLLGPLNRSESAVALQRAKNQGYKDAFVWHN